MLAPGRDGPHPLAALFLIVALAAPAGAQPARSADTPDWRGTGVVLAVLPPPSDLHATRTVIVIQHEAIPGLMEDAMSMPFLVASTALVEGIRPGDRIAFRLEDAPDALLVVSIERLPRR
jgi:Cu(I)/Ag(I) efflux system periplasmic protein CusF